MKKILINTTQPEELRVAIIDAENQALLDLLLEHPAHKTKTGNIYLGKITAVEDSLDAAFVNFGSERHGFLPFKEINPSYLKKSADDSDASPKVRDSIREGQMVMVQVEKEERGNKGAALTTFISLAGSYLVLMPNNPRAGGISRRVEGEERDQLREILSNLPIPEDMGLIVRTAGVGKENDELQWDLTALLKHWESIQEAAKTRNTPFLIHQESDVVIRTIRDHLRQDVSEIWVDDADIYARIKHHLEQVRPDFVHCLKEYTSNIPLFSRHQVEHQIESAHQREVRMPSGASIVFGYTEALVAIDINSGQATKGKDIEQTALAINKEAASFIASQLRLRDIGGLIVIDFIDMPSSRYRRDVENELRNALRMDKARTQVGSISQRFGLLEMSRQRLRQSLRESTRLTCVRCDGWGSVRSIESLALSILRMIEEDAIRPGTAQIQAFLPVDLSTFIINEKRDVIASIEKLHEVQVLVIPTAKLESPHYRIKRITGTEVSGSNKSSASYDLIESPDADLNYKNVSSAKRQEKPAVQSLFSHQQATDKKSAGLVKRLFSTLFGSANDGAETAPAESKPANTSTSQARSTNRPQNKRRPRQTSNKRTTPKPAISETEPTESKPAANRSRRGVRGGKRKNPTDKTPAAQRKQSENSTTDSTIATTEDKGMSPKNRRKIQPRRRTTTSTTQSDSTTEKTTVNASNTPNKTEPENTTQPTAKAPESKAQAVTDSIAKAATPAPVILASDQKAWQGPRKIISSTGTVVAPATTGKKAEKPQPVTAEPADKKRDD